ncbi:MAG: hypothetical protein RBG13Loki_2837 [Promethearchaeota archaeon CR_4]|nr:MAG: hypothetical protein RBG13Loki_2837 [Candidatus Lokiarchaeota archaeon CR_4]
MKNICAFFLRFNNLDAYDPPIVTRNTDNDTSQDRIYEDFHVINGGLVEGRGVQYGSICRVDAHD